MAVALSLEHQEIYKNYTKEVSVKNLTNLTEMKNKLNLIFGVDHNAITKNNIFEENDNSIPARNYKKALEDRKKEVHYTVTVHFPEITITNSRNKSHVIRDLYVRFAFSGEFKLVPFKNSVGTVATLMGMKTTYTPYEWNSFYTHSHLSGRQLHFTKFCTGTGPINQLMMLLGTNFSQVNLNMFLLSLQNYVKWESLEGQPYKKIQDIGVAPEFPTNLYLDATSIQGLFAHVYVKLINSYKKLQYTITESGVQVAPTDEFDVELAAAIRAMGNGDFRTIFGSYSLEVITPFKVGDNQYAIAVADEATSIDRNDRTRVLLEFKNQPKTLQIINTNNGNSNIHYTHPYILGNICRLFGEHLSKRALGLQNAS